MGDSTSVANSRAARAVKTPAVKTPFVLLFRRDCEVVDSVVLAGAPIRLADRVERRPMGLEAERSWGPSVRSVNEVGSGGAV